MSEQQIQANIIPYQPYVPHSPSPLLLSSHEVERQGTRVPRGPWDTLERAVSSLLLRSTYSLSQKYSMVSVFVQEPQLYQPTEVWWRFFYALIVQAKIVQAQVLSLHCPPFWVNTSPFEF